MVPDLAKGREKLKVLVTVVSEVLRPHGLEPTRLLCPWDFPGKNTGVGCCFLLQGMFLTQGSNSSILHLLHCRQILYNWAQDARILLQNHANRPRARECSETYVCIGMWVYLMYGKEHTTNHWEQNRLLSRQCRENWFIWWRKINLNS